MGGNVIGQAGQAVQGATGGKSSGLGSNYTAPGYTPVGGAPARAQPAYQAPQQTQMQQPQYMSGSAMGGFGGGFNPYAQQPMQPQLGGKSSGLGQMGMMGSPYGQQGFNPYGGFGGLQGVVQGATMPTGANVPNPADVMQGGQMRGNSGYGKPSPNFGRPMVMPRGLAAAMYNKGGSVDE